MPEKDTDLAAQHSELKCLHQGHSRYACNRMYGAWNGRDLCAFDYHYVIGHGKHQQTHNISVVMLDGGLPLKPLYIRREGFTDKISEFFGMDDIDFESAEFSREFHVTSPDKKWAYDVLHPRMMEYLMTSPRLAIQFDNQVVAVLGQGNAAFSPVEFEFAARLAEGVLNRLPEYLVRQQRDENQTVLQTRPIDL